MESSIGKGKEIWRNLLSASHTLPSNEAFRDNRRHSVPFMQKAENRVSVIKALFEALSSPKSNKPLPPVPVSTAAASATTSPNGLTRSAYSKDRMAQVKKEKATMSPSSMEKSTKASRGLGLGLNLHELEVITASAIISRAEDEEKEENAISFFGANGRGGSRRVVSYGSHRGAESEPSISAPTQSAAELGEAQLDDYGTIVPNNTPTTPRVNSTVYFNPEETLDQYLDDFLDEQYRAQVS